MKVSELGEFGLIELIARTIREGSPPPPAGLLIGIGDDAAAWRSDAPVHLATTDTMVDGVHFKSSQITWEELGWKSLAVNLSDIGAMGGVPQYALVTLAIATDTMVEEVISLYRGMLAVANPFGVAIAGGDIVRSPVSIITISLFGVVENDAGRIMTRGGARAGDLVYVTGFVGSSAAGLKMVQESLVFEPETATYLRQAHFRPQPRVLEGRKLVEAGVRCAIDISDGLVGDLTHICEASKVGARILIENIPIHPLTRAAFPGECLEMALSGGEDYEILFTAGAAAGNLGPAAPLSATAIGEITAENCGKVVLVDKSGRTFVKSKAGWDHFSPAQA